MTRCVVTTSVGRWRHLEQAFPTWSRCLQGVIDEVLCITAPQCSESTAVRARQVGMRVHEVELPCDALGQPRFHKTKLLNEGVRSLGGRYDQLLLLDSDTLVFPGFAEELACFPEGEFGFCRNPFTKRDLTGVLVVNTSDWARVGGMDERFRDWGAEDLDLRLRLRFGAGRSYHRIDPSHLQSLTHSDDLRVALLGTPNKFESLERNNRLMAANYRQATGRELVEDLVDSRELQELLGLADELQQRGGRLVRAHQQHQ